MFGGLYSIPFHFIPFHSVPSFLLLRFTCFSFQANLSSRHCPKLLRPGMWPSRIAHLGASILVTSLAFRMVANMEKWRDEWVAEVKPSDEEIAQREADIAKLLGWQLWRCQLLISQQP